MRYLLFSFFSFLLFTSSLAQGNNWSFTNYTSADGLADNNINCITQDSRGFVWFGTREGLSRFDGKNFKNYFQGTNNNLLPGNIISDVQEYQYGHLLMLISNTQLATLNTLTGQFAYPSQFAKIKITAIKKGIGKNFFVSSFTDTCFEINEQLQIINTFIPPFQKQYKYTSVDQLDSNTLLFGRLGEFFLYDIPHHQYSLFLHPLAGIVDPTSFRHYDQGKQLLYFINFSDGIICYNKKGEKIHQWKPGKTAGSLGSNQVTAIRKKSKEELWVCTADDGLAALNLSTNLFSKCKNDPSNPRSLLSDFVAASFTDKDNNLWLATEKGVSKLSGNTAAIQSWHAMFETKDNNTFLAGIAQTRDGTVFQPQYATHNCYRISPSSNELVLLDKKQVPYMWAAEDFGDAILLHGFGTGICFYNPTTGTYSTSDFLKTHFPSSEIITLAFKQRNEDEWYSGNHGGGMIRIDASTKQVYTYKNNQHSLFHNGYYSYAAEDNNGDVWFGVNKSELLLQWQHTTNSFKEILFDTVPGISYKGFGGIFDLSFDKVTNSLWIAFEGAGIVNYHISNHTATQYTMQNGLPSNYVYALAIDHKGRVWAGTHKGLSCMLPSVNRFVTFTTADGLPDDVFDDRCILADKTNNSIWAATAATLMHIDPDSLLNIKRESLAVYVDNVIVNGSLLQAADFNHTSFKPNENNVQFSFSAPALKGGTDIEYNYMLKGSDKNWISAGNINTASYNNLQPGDYTFIVRAKHKGNTQWSETIAPFSFHIQTPWYASLWFKTLVAFLLVALVLYINRLYYLRKLEKQQAVEKERTRIATDMHDDFGASLSRIKFISEKLKYTDEEDEEILKNDLSKISYYSDEMSQKLNEIVWALNKRYDTLGDLISYCRDYASEAFIENNIHFLFVDNIKTDIDIQGEIRRNVFLTIKEAVNNIIKHAGATDVNIQFSYTEHQLFVQIKDNGKGIDFNKLRPFANGLENMKKRVADIGGVIEIKNDEGTQIAFTVPIR
ncbi:MAG: hypothetical protein EKK37_06480 [Sphingobacteriales bacterium]|nr:MAG: hypothetical protein EKK37_06480 [Sphingobacteriales bacterium]